MGRGVWYVFVKFIFLSFGNVGNPFPFVGIFTALLNDVDGKERVDFRELE